MILLKGGHHLREGTGWLGDAVHYEPVSPPISPANREFIREICRFGHFAMS
jgi:hypothetical protein